MNQAIELTQLFGNIYLHLHPRRDVGEYRPSSASLAIVRHLAMAGPLTVGEAARHLRRSQAATSELLNRLIERGLLDRQVDERDRRVHRVWLTAVGQQLVTDETEPLDRHQLREVLARLSSADQSEILSAFRRLADAARQHATTKRRNDDERVPQV